MLTVKRKLKEDGESDSRFQFKKDNWGKVDNLTVIKDLMDQGNKIIIIIYAIKNGALTYFLKIWFLLSLEIDNHPRTLTSTQIYEAKMVKATLQKEQRLETKTLSFYDSES